MAEGSDYRIKKIEKGPLQRFKNQNLLIKKFGEIGLQVYKAITGKRTTAELQKDLGIEPQLFDQIISYMQDAEMVELEPIGGKGVAPPPAEAEKPEEAIQPEEEKPARRLEELPPEEAGPEEERPPLEEKPQEEEITFEEIKPIEFGEEMEEEKSAKKKKVPPAEEELPREEIQPVSMEEEVLPEEEKPPEEGVIQPEEEKPISPEEEVGIAFEEEAPRYKEEPELSPVEKIISDKYGDIGLRVYSLIDGQRTAEEIMRETGLTEPKLVEILDFMDEQGIIKLDYPKGAGGAAPPPPVFGGPQVTVGPGVTAAQPPLAGQKKEETGYVPMVAGEEELEEARAVPSPVEVPLKAPMDIVKSVQMKAKVMLKYGDKGGKLLEQIDGKNDTIDIALKLDIPLYTVSDMLKFMMENGIIIMKPVSRADVRKKYGDDGYAVYKRFGKEGLMLYELIGKELTIKQMAEKITTDKSKIIDMFIFIHKVLGIELPIDRDVLAKQLGL